MTKTKVMIVDDEIEFAQPLSERLMLRNFATQTAVCAEDAVTIMRTNWRPDVVVLDLRMPGLDGLDTLSLLKQLDPAVEVIIVSGHGSTMVGIEGMRRGLFDYLLKPVEIEELVERIKSAAAKRKLTLKP